MRSSLKARFVVALLDVDDWEAARTQANQELDQFRSERMDGARYCRFLGQAAGYPIPPTSGSRFGLDRIHPRADRARRLQAARANLVAKLRPSELEERKAAAGVEAHICTRDNAVDVLVPVEGFVRAVDRIRARYFKNHEIVYPNHLDHLDACRYGIHSVLVAFEEQRGGDDSWIARLTDPSLPVEGEPTDSDYVDHQKRVQERINHTARNAVRENSSTKHTSRPSTLSVKQLPPTGSWIRNWRRCSLRSQSFPRIPIELPGNYGAPVRWAEVAFSERKTAG